MTELHVVIDLKIKKHLVSMDGYEIILRRACIMMGGDVGSASSSVYEWPIYVVDRLSNIAIVNFRFRK